MQTGSVVLLSNASATGSSVQWPGGMGVFKADGTFGGATLTLQYLGPAGTWCAVGTNTTLTAAGGGGFVLDPCPIRVAVSGGPPSGIYAYAGRVPD